MHGERLKGEIRRRSIAADACRNSVRDGWISVFLRKQEPSPALRTELLLSQEHAALLVDQEAASWKMMPSVKRTSLRRRLTPWRIWTRWMPRAP